MATSLPSNWDLSPEEVNALLNGGNSWTYQDGNPYANLTLSNGQKWNPSGAASGIKLYKKGDRKELIRGTKGDAETESVYSDPFEQDTYDISGDLSALTGTPDSSNHVNIQYIKVGNKLVPTSAPGFWNWNENHKADNMSLLTSALIMAPAIAGVAGAGAGAAGSGSGAATGLGAGGSDLATSAAWSNGAAGLGGDTLGAIGMTPEWAAAGAGAEGSGLLSKAALDGTTAFGANSVPGALEVGSYAGTAIPSAVDLGSAGGIASTGASGGLLSQAASGAGSAGVSAAAKAAGGLLDGTAAKVAAAAAGGLLGSQPTTSSTNSQSKIDPRMEKYLYGDGNTQGILDQAYQWQQANKSGLNDQMRQGLASINRVASDPSGYQAIQQQGLSLMNQPVAGNPFSNGQATLQTGTPQALRNLGFK